MYCVMHENSHSVSSTATLYRTREDAEAAALEKARTSSSTKVYVMKAVGEVIVATSHAIRSL